MGHLRDVEGHGDDFPAGEDQQQWAEAIGDILAEVYGGATAMPVAKGKWFNDKTGKIVTEDVILIHSYVLRATQRMRTSFGESQPSYIVWESEPSRAKSVS